jgi:hypothetical protein
MSDALIDTDLDAGCVNGPTWRLGGHINRLGVLMEQQVSIGAYNLIKNAASTTNHQGREVGVSAG